MNRSRVSNRFGNVVPSKNRVATIHLVQSSRFARRFAKLLLLGLALSIVGIMFLPWQQTSAGTGQVVAFAPQERQQTVQSPTKGVVARIAPGLAEGSEVKEGDFILEIQPFAANLKTQLELQLSDLKTKMRTAEVKAEAYGDNVTAFTEAMKFTVQAASQMVESAKAKLEAKQRLVRAYEAKELQARQNFERQDALFKEKLKPEKEVEKKQKDLDVATAELAAVKQDVTALEQELEAKRSELKEKRLVAQTKIDKARALQQDALSSAATTQKEIREVEVKIQEMDRLVITAPRDGVIFRMPIFEQNQTVKEGEPLLTIIPEASQIAVELAVNGNDMPLVQLGQEVRLQFEGWPAVQFAGWPSVAVGTFSGVVTTIDATDNGKGEFRILVTPNPGQKEWPSERYLRQGVRANGWVMLKQVSLGYEIWRQLNGFPVIIAEEEPSKDKSSKVPKLPK